MALTGLLATFVLPFAFPLQTPVFSPVYTAGGNNRVGATAAGALCLLVTTLCWRLRLFARISSIQSHNEQRLSFAWLWGAIAVVTTYTAALGSLMVREGMYYADAGYFLTQLRTGLVFHQQLYKGVEFAYGPLLFYWPALFVRVLGVFHISAEVAYVCSLCAMEAGGTALLFYCVSALPMHRHMKLAAFLALFIVTLDPQEGLNYTAFRFVFSLTSLILLTRQTSAGRSSLVAAAGAIANFAVSPEVGIAFLSASIVYGIFFSLRQGRRWFAIVVASVAGAALFTYLVGWDYFRTLREFAGGGYNMLLEPAPHILLLLFCALCLAPMVVAAALRDTQRDATSLRRTGLLLSFMIVGIALLPAAFGRCDPLHVAFNGWPFFLLAFIAMDSMQRTAQRAGVVLAFLFCTYSVAQECALGSGPLRKLVTQTPDPYEMVAMPQLQHVLGHQQVSFPWYTPMRAADKLTAAGQFHPLFLCISAVDATAEQRTVQNIREASFVMAPQFLPLIAENKINNVGMKAWFRFGYQYRARHKPFLQGLLLVKELEDNWQFVGTFGSYNLFRKIR